MFYIGKVYNIRRETYEIKANKTWGPGGSWKGRDECHIVKLELEHQKESRKRTSFSILLNL